MHLTTKIMEKWKQLQILINQWDKQGHIGFALQETEWLLGDFGQLRKFNEEFGVLLENAEAEHEREIGEWREAVSVIANTYKPDEVLELLEKIGSQAEAKVTVVGGDTPNVFVWHGKELIAKFWFYPKGKVTYRVFYPKVTLETEIPELSQRQSVKIVKTIHVGKQTASL